jgi:hypothetical protein
MGLKQCLIRIAGVLALAVVVGPAYSGPLGSAAGNTASASKVSTSISEQIAYRVCSTRGGVRRCHYAAGAYGYRGYIPSDPRAYRTGTLRWWNGMTRWDRAGTGSGGAR